MIPDLGKNPEKKLTFLGELLAYFNHFYAPEGQRNTFLTLYYVAFGRIIGLCDDFK